MVTFTFFAPHKPFVSLVGDFNGWNTRANIMQQDGSGLWWATLPYPGPTRYGFYVAIDSQSHAWVGDPYAREVQWDESGPWAYLPNAESVQNRHNFKWADHLWRTPHLRDLVIYEVSVRDFGGQWVQDRPLYGTFRAVEQRLDYLRDLGINALELMPIQQFPGKSSWGYNPVFYFAPASVYGNVEDFMRLVDACHRRGIAVILDVVFNHAWGDHPYYQIYPPLWGPKGEQLEDLNPFFHQTPPSINMWGGADWDHFTEETTHYFQDVVRFWIEEMHVDGFRFDWVGGVDYDSRDPMSPGFHPYHGIRAICWAARQVKADVILTGEYWPLEGTNPDKSAQRLVEETEMDAVWNGTFHHTIEEVLNQRWQWETRDIWRAIGGYRDLGYERADQVINYSASHDEVRIVHEVLFYARRHIQKPDSLTWLETALRKSLLGQIALFAAPGVPLLWMGQEWGEDAPRTVDFLPLDWPKLDRSPQGELWRSVRRLIEARHRHPALRSDRIDFYADDFGGTGIVRWRRLDGEGEDEALIALNFSAEKRETSLHFPWNGPWREVVQGRVHTIRNQRRRFTLEPYSGRLYVPVRPLKRHPEKRI